jgi:hypothetical protein
VSQPGDTYEREADAIASRVMSGESPSIVSGAARAHVQRSARRTHAAPATPPGTLAQGLRSASQPLDPGTRGFMESRFGHDFGHVRIHTTHDAALTARDLHARAYTFGGDIVFGQGEYVPTSQAGRKLLAHELAHIVQQSGSASTSLPADVVPRAPTISVLDENFIGPPSQSQRRAARSCPIDCCFQNLGTLHAMPLFHHQSRGAQVAAGSAAATGIGAALHFIANPTQPPAGDVCHCDDFRMIQILTTSAGHEADPRGRSNFVDNDPAGNSPFYGDTGLTGRGEHAIPRGYTDAGERITTTESIYDRPYREHADLGNRSLSWMAETCVACIKNNAPDRILGGVTYGFTQNFNAVTNTFDPVVAVDPQCVSHPSRNFLNTLSTDPTTTNYSFSGNPTLLECFPDLPVGDFPEPERERTIA